MKGRHSLQHAIQHANHLIRCGDAGVPFSNEDKLLMMQAARILSQLKKKAVVRLYRQQTSVATVAKTLHLSKQAVETILHQQLEQDKENLPVVKASETLQRLSIEELELSRRTKNCLIDAEILTIGALLAQDQVQLLKLPNFGRKSLNEVVDVLKSYQLRLPFRHVI